MEFEYNICMSKDIINQLSKKEIIKKLYDNKIKHLWLFGSFAKWNNSKDSDVDLLYEYDANLPNNGWSFWFFACINMIEDELKRKIDFIG